MSDRMVRDKSADKLFEAVMAVIDEHACTIGEVLVVLAHNAACVVMGGSGMPSRVVGRTERDEAVNKLFKAIAAAVSAQYGRPPWHGAAVGEVLIALAHAAGCI